MNMCCCDIIYYIYIKMAGGIPSLSHSWIILDSRLYPFMKFLQAIQY